MAIINETIDTAINPYARSNTSMGYDDTFVGTFGGGDWSDAVNLPTMVAGTTYTITIVLEDVNSLSNLTIINPNNFHSTGFNLTDGVVTNPDAWVHPTGMGTREEMRVIGSTVEFDFTPGLNQWYALQINGDGAVTSGYSVTFAAKPIPPTFTDVADSVTGTSGADLADLLHGNDTYDGGDGNDTVNGGTGDDVVNGGLGNDSLLGDNGNDVINGDDGDDSLQGNGGNDSLTGGIGKDSLDGGNQDDTLDGGDGNDWLFGGYGDDVLTGGAGDDTLAGSFGADQLTGGTGADTFIVDPPMGADTVTDFENGVDHIDVTALGLYDVAQIAMTTNGTDTGLNFGNGNTLTLLNTLPGDLSNADFVLKPNPFLSSAANDKMVGDDADNVMSGGDGDDRLIGGGGHDQLNGDAGKDDLRGGTGNDTLNGGDGNDKLQGEDGDDVLNGGNNNDNLQGGAGSDLLNGGDGHDLLDGGDDNDVLMGETGKDKLFGGNGDDTLNGGEHNDWLTGGAGIDTFVFEAGTGMDTVMDFEDGIDQIDLQAYSGMGLTDFSMLIITQEGLDAVIALEPGSSITLANTDVTALDATDFVF